MSGSYDRPTGPPGSSRRSGDQLRSLRHRADGAPRDPSSAIPTTRRRSADERQPRASWPSAAPQAEERAVEQRRRAARSGHRPLAHARHLHHVLPRLPDRRRRLHDQRIRQRLAQGHRQRGHRADRAARWHGYRQDRARCRAFLRSRAGISRANALSLDDILQAARALARPVRCPRSPAGAAAHRHRDRPQRAARHRRAARRADEAVSTAPRSTIIAAGSSRSAP